MEPAKASLNYLVVFSVAGGVILLSIILAAIVYFIRVTSSSADIALLKDFGLLYFHYFLTIIFLSQQKCKKSSSHLHSLRARTTVTDRSLMDDDEIAMAWRPSNY